MTSRQCEIEAESFAACLFAQAGYDVLVQYGPNQPHHDLVANKGSKLFPISVKGSQDGGWMLAVKYVKLCANYHEAIDMWLAAQRKDVVFLFIQFIGVEFGTTPRACIARTPEIAVQMKTQCHGRGHGALLEYYQRDHPESKYDHRIPPAWIFSQRRLGEIEL